MDTKKELRGTGGEVMSTPNEVPSLILPLTPMQQGMLFDALAGQATGLNIVQLVVEFAEGVDTDAIRRAWEVVVGRHEALRAGFALEPTGDGRQVIADRVEVPWREVRWSTETGVWGSERLEAFLDADRQLPFDLATPPLMRFVVIKTSDRESLLIWTYHHLLLDGQSCWSVLREVSLLFQADIAGTRANLPAPVSIRAYTEWLESRQGSGEEAYWREALGGFSSSSSLTAGLGSVGMAEVGRASQEYEDSLSAAETNGLTKLARDLRVTPSILFQAFWAVLLARYTGTDDVVFGSTRACRRWGAGATQAVGLVMNVLPVRVRVEREGTFRSLVEGLRSQHLAIRGVEHAPLIKIRAWSKVPGRVSLFESVVNFELAMRAPEEGDFVMVRRRRLVERMKVPMGIWAYWGDTVALKVQYDPARFHPAIVANIVGHLKTAMHAALQKPEIRVRDIPLLTAAEHRQVVVDWNRTEREYPRDQCVHELFREIAEEHPDRVAVEFGDRQVTYAELNRSATAVARTLAGLGVKPGTSVGIISERSVELIAGLLGTLMAGGMYVPLYPGDPIARQSAMLDVAGAQILLDPRPAGPAPGPASEAPLSVKVVRLAALAEPGVSETKGADVPLPPVVVTADDPAYVMFTSGSTGRPKGVSVKHRSVVRLVRGADYARLDGDQVFLQLAPLAFDASTFEVWGALLNAGKLALMPPGAPTPAEIGKAVRQHGVTILWLTSGLFDLMVDERIDDLRGVNQILTGGDVLSPGHVGRALRALDGSALVNGYGPTENTTFTCCHRVELADLERASIPIGRPIANTRAYVVDEHLEPLPVGVWGELLACGDGVAAGYLGDPGSNDRLFVPDPFSGIEGARAYRTGDYCRWLPEGLLEFRGRIDEQVKLRGFRVELGEIQAALEKCAGVKAAVVIAREGPANSKEIVAYWVPLEEAPVRAESALREAVRAKLPDYAVPARFIRLEALPVTANGKVDRHALPAPARPGGEAPNGTLPPRNLIEQQLVEIWEQVLDTRPIGIRDDFFELGGHSLLALQLILEVEKTLNYPLPVESLLEKLTTVEAMAGLIAAQTATDHALPDTGDLPLADYRSLVANGLGIPGRRVGSARIIAEVAEGRPGRTPFFLVGSDLLDAVETVDPDLPLYCSPSVWFVPEAGPGFVQSMGKLLAREIAEVRPSGPIAIGGFCLSGWFAYEAAQELSRRGRTVELLFLIDQFPPLSRGIEAAARYRGLLRGILASIDRVPWRKRPGLLLAKAARRVARRRSSMHREEVPGDETNPWHKRDRLLEAIAAYPKRPYDGRARLVLTDQGAIGNALIRRSWRKLLRGDVKFQHRVGEHFRFSVDLKTTVRLALRKALLRSRPYPSEGTTSEAGVPVEI